MGEAGASFIVKLLEAGEVPQTFVAVTVYVPAVTIRNVPLVLVEMVVVPDIKL